MVHLDKKRLLSQLFFAMLIIFIALVATWILYFNKPTAEKLVFEKKPSLVETVTVKKSDQPIKIAAYGTVQPHRELTLQAEVKGRVIELSQNLDSGGLLKEGEILIKVDPRDYIVLVEQNRAKVEKAEFDLIVEKGKRVIAEKEWELLDPTLKQAGIGKDLALRIPHLREKEAALQSAQSSLEKSLIDLQRTLVRAPFNSLVLEEFVEKGQLVMPQTKVATLVATDEFRVQVSIPYEQLSWLNMARNGDLDPIVVKVIQEIGTGKKIIREGYVLRLLGDLDPNGRMVQLLIVIKDPLDLKGDQPSTIPLLLGTYVEVLFDGPNIEKSLELPRKALHEENKIWVKGDDNKLKIYQVEVIAGDRETIIVTSSDIEDGDEVIISKLPVAIPGMELRKVSDIIEIDETVD